MNPMLKYSFIALVAVVSLAATKPASRATAKTPAQEPVYELPETGITRERPQGGWINVEPQGTRLVVKFFDKEKKPMAPDVARGLVRLKYSSKNPVQAVLTAAGDTLATPATIRPPHNFLVILSLFASDSAEASESYTFKYP
ncbi:MAG: hypothetical protein ACOZE5_14740 [Verrucomicrobiota bacterium]